jgi:uncharacterized membrane protein
MALIQWLRRSFIAGLLVTVPLVISVAALYWIFGIIDGFTASLARRLLGEDKVPPGLGLLITALVILGVGGRHCHQCARTPAVCTGESWLMKVPVFRTIYTPVKQLVAAFSPDTEHGFKRVVLVEDAAAGGILGFLTKSSGSSGNGARRFWSRSTYRRTICIWATSECFRASARSSPTSASRKAFGLC